MQLKKSLPAALGLSALTALMNTPVLAQTEADRIFINGQIYTMTEASPWAQAVAIDDGIIIAVGSSKEVLELKTKHTDVIDLAGQTVMPGFHDLHVHPLYAGISAMNCVIPEGANLKQALAIVSQCAKTTAKNTAKTQWITGRQWDVSALGVMPHKSMLDKVTQKHPVFLRDTSGHSAWVNSRALALAGIDANTPSPPGGIIERDAAGIPTGVLRESAISLVEQVIPKHDAKTLDNALAWSLEKMLSHGITSFVEASAGFVAGAQAELQTYARLADAGVLQQRARVCITWEPGIESYETPIAWRNFYNREKVRTDCIKIHLDGVPTDSHTAAMLEPYAGKVVGRNDKASESGLLLFDIDVLNRGVAKFDQMGLTVKFHAAGDAAVRAALDAIEVARKTNGFSGTLHDVGHCTFVSKQDVPRAASIAATFEVSPYLWSPSPINDDITAAVGDARMDRVWPVKELIESGALVVPGSDWSVVSSANPWPAIEALVTRERPGGSTDSYGKQQAITLQQALQLFTVNSARHQGNADKLGRIAVGMLADLVIIDKNPFQIPVRELHKIHVNQTVIDGEIVYKRSDV